MPVDLNNHTVLCNHAAGTMEEYIERAIERGECGDMGESRRRR